MTEDEAIETVRDMFLAFLEHVEDVVAEDDGILDGLDAMLEILIERAHVEVSDNS